MSGAANGHGHDDDLRAELARVRAERDDFEAQYHTLVGKLGQMRSTLGDRLRQDAEELDRRAEKIETLTARVGKLEDERDQAERSARELQAVLEEFQSTQEAEVARAVNEQSTRLEAVEAELAVERAKVSALEAEVSAQAGLSTRASDLEAAVREKNLLIGKLRHEAVILNEHLSEALRRLRATSSDGTVDRRLVTNLLVQFLSTPRADAKRFEMLRVLADILGWSDAERQAAGLARATKNSAPPLQSQHQDESFSNLFVEFLLSEAESGSSPSTPSKPQPTPSTSSLTKK